MTRPLADYEGGDWLGAGWHTVTVMAWKLFEYNTGSEGLELTVADDRNRQKTISFCLAGKGPNRLAAFAKACGLSQAKLEAYDLDNKNSHQILANKRVQIELVRGEKYCEVEGWLPVGEPVPVEAPLPTQAYKSSQPGTPVEEAPPTGSEIPF